MHGTEVQVVFLVVESAPSTREALCYVLLSFGIKGIPAASRRDAWELLAAHGGIEGAIIDIDNKEVEGVALVRELKENEKTRNLTIIVHTVQSRKEFVLSMIDIGVAGYLLKPFDPETAHAKLSPILAKVATHDKQRKHIRIQPDESELARVHFRLPSHPSLVSGRIIDISLGGIAVELLNPADPALLAPESQIQKLEFVLAGRELAPSARIVMLKSNVLALRFSEMSSSEKTALERYIFKRISS